ncbi:MAG: PAS domain S-box protein, partial [Methanosarcinaceae archaeon]|nr:PAS domain S-box protein [Methanosarcinaceae archaeon]
MRWKDIALEKKLTVLLVAGVVMMSFLFASLSISTATTKQEELAYQQSIQTTRSYANHFDADMAAAMAIGRTVAITMEQYKNADRDEINNILKQLLLKNPNLIGTYVCYEPNAFDGKDAEYINAYGHDPTGRFIPYWNRFKGPDIISLDPLQDYDTWGYYQLPKLLHHDVITEPYLYEGELIVSFVSPIMDEHDKFIGIGGVDLSLNYIDKTVSDVRIFDSGYAIVTSRTGILMSHPVEKGWIGMKKLDDFNDNAISKMADDIDNGKEGYIETLDPTTGKDVIMFYEPVKTSDYSFILIVPKAEMLAGVADLRNRMILISAFSILFMGLLAYLITGFVSRPINRILDNFKAISDDAILGKLDTRADTDVDIDFRKIPEGLNDILDSLTEANLLKEEMQNMLNFSPLIVFKWKAEGNWPVVLVSENITQFGYTQEEFLSGEKDYGDIVFPEDINNVKIKLSENIEAGTPKFGQEHRIITKFGDVRWVDERTLIQRNSKGDVECLQGIILDITDKKKAEEAMLESEKKYRLIFENSPLGIFHFDQHGAITHCNSKFLNIIDATGEEIIGFNMMTSIRDENMKVAVEAVLSGNPGHYEGKYCCVISGKLVPIKAEYNPNISEDGSLLGGIGIFEDITLRKQAEEAMIESEMKYRLIFENSPLGIFHFDKNGVITHCNENIITIIGI